MKKYEIVIIKDDVQSDFTYTDIRTIPKIDENEEQIIKKYICPTRSIKTKVFHTYNEISQYIPVEDMIMECFNAMKYNYSQLSVYEIINMLFDDYYKDDRRCIETIIRQCVNIYIEARKDGIMNMYQKVLI